MPLVYNKVTRDRDFLETDMARVNGINPVIGQSFSKFINYNNLVLADVKKTCPTSYKELGDPNELLAVKTCTSTCTVYRKEHSTVRYSLRDGNDPNDPRMMNDKNRQIYMVSIVKWVKKNYEEETLMCLKKRHAAVCLAVSKLKTKRFKSMSYTKIKFQNLNSST